LFNVKTPKQSIAVLPRKVKTIISKSYLLATIS
jgi:hypothetical protein